MADKKTDIKNKYKKSTTRQRFDYHKENILQSLRDGVSVMQICKDMHFSRAAFYAYMESDEALREQVKGAQMTANLQVESALFKSALGYFITEERVNKEGEPYTIQRYIEPNITAQIFYLKNRMPDKWRDRTENLLSAGEDVVLKIGFGKDGKDDKSGD